MGCTTHQSEILVRPQHGAAMMRNFPAINRIDSVCCFSSSYWYWKNMFIFNTVFLALPFYHFLYAFNATFLIPSPCRSFHLSHSFLSLCLCFYYLGLFYFLSSFLSFFTFVFDISYFLLFFCRPFLFNFFLILFTILAPEDLFPFRSVFMCSL